MYQKEPNQNAKGISKSQIKGITYNPAWYSYIVDFYFSKMRFYFNHWKTLPEAVWRRKVAEEYFGIEVLNRNPIAIEQFDKLEDSKKKEIEEYTIQRIKERLAYYESKVA